MDRIVKFIIIEIILFLLFVVFYALYMRFFKGDIVFYSSLKSIGYFFLFGLVTTMVVWYIMKQLNKPFDYPTYIIALLTSIFVNWSFYMTLPGVIERSFSVHVIGYVHMNSITGKGVSKEEIYNDLINNYFKGSTGTAAVDRRVSEQIETGTFEERDGLIYMTDKGETIYKFFSLQNSLFKLGNKRYDNKEGTE